jgi:hypothetical protein
MQRFQAWKKLVEEGPMKDPLLDLNLTRRAGGDLRKL